MSEKFTVQFCALFISDTTSFGCRDQGRDSVRRASMHVDASCNSGVGQIKAIFQVEGNTFCPVVFSYLIADWLIYNFAAGSFHTTKLCSRLYWIAIEFYSEKLKTQVFEPPFGDLGITYALHL